MSQSQDQEKTLPALRSPSWCDHGPIVRTCSQCCATETCPHRPNCGVRRAQDADAQASRLRGNDIPWARGLERLDQEDNDYADRNRSDDSDDNAE